jgi:hypothetical protein
MQILYEIGPIFSANQQSQRADVYKDDALRFASVGPRRMTYSMG